MSPKFLEEIISHLITNSKNLTDLAKVIPDSEDNLEALSQVEVANHQLRFNESHKDLADLAWDLESMNIPEELKDKYSQAEWETFTRLVTLFLTHHR